VPLCLKDFKGMQYVTVCCEWLYHCL